MGITVQVVPHADVAAEQPQAGGEYEKKNALLEQEYLARRESIAKFDFDSFRIEEAKRREQLGAGRANDIFFSHCWRGKDEKTTKRKWAINEWLTRPEAKGGPNYRAWCDYLDLQAKGPVAWRKEIEDGIRDAGKVVCLVDVPYLHSFNCLQEVAMAQRMGKPIIFVMLEKPALDILSSADHGAGQLWSDKPPPEAGANQPLRAFANANWGSADGSDPFDHAKLAKCLERISNVNFCMCKDDDYANKGEDGVMEMVIDFVSADLPYQKEHARLLALAADGSKLLYGKELKAAQGWLGVAEKEGREPQPTEEMKKMIERSARASRLRGLAIGAAMSLLFIGALIGMVVAIAFAENARVAETNATNQLSRALNAETLALNAEKLANEEASNARAAETQALQAVNRTLVQLARSYATDKRQTLYDRLRFGQAAVTIAGNTDGGTDDAQAYDALVQTLADQQAGMELVRYEDHTNFVLSVAWSPDGTRLASASKDKTVRIWSSSTGEMERVLEGHTSVVNSVSWSPDGTRLASASWDKTVRIWSSSTGETERVLEGHTESVNSVSWSPDGTRLASASGHFFITTVPNWGYDHTVRIWSSSTGETERVLEGHTSDVESVSWSPDGTRLASASSDKTVRIWSSSTGETERVLKGHADSVYSVSWSPDGMRLASAGWEEVRIWSSSTGETERVLEGDTSNVESVSWSPDGTRLASAGWEEVRIWSSSTGETERVLEGHTSVIVNSVSWSPDGMRLASAGWDGTVRIWSSSAGETERVLVGHTSDVESVSWSPDGTRLASASLDKTVRIWSSSTGETERVLEGHTHYINSVSWSPDGTRLASASSDGTVRIWSSSTGETERVLEGHTANVWSVSWSPDDTRLASASVDNTVRIWSSSTGETERVLKGHTSDGFSSSVNSVSWSPDGTRLASASDDSTVRIWSSSTGETERVLKGHTFGVKSVSWSPDGTRLASASSDGTVRIWSSSTGETERVLEGHTSVVNSVSWSPDGTRLASASWDDTVRVWLKSLTNCGEDLSGHEWSSTVIFYTDPIYVPKSDPIHGVSFSPSDSSLVVAAGRNIHLYKYLGKSADELVNDAARVASRANVTAIRETLLSSPSSGSSAGACASK